MGDMKKIVFTNLFLASLFLMGHSALALSDIEITGEVDAVGEIFYMPTGKQGDSEFRVPTLLLDLNIPLKDGNLLVVNFEGAERSSNSEASRFEVQTREAYFDLVSVFNGMYALRGGLLPQPWQEAQYQDWSYRFLGETAWVITEKWRYQSYSDLGLSFMGELPNDWGEGAISLVNGEGRDQGEIGPHKEIGFFVRLLKVAPWAISLNYIRGNYDLYGESVGLKERLQGQVTYRGDNWWAGLEVLSTRDPADAITTLKIAEEVDVMDYAGQSVDGLGGSAFVTVSTGSQSEVMLRYDYLNAVVGADGKDLSTAMGAWAYRISDDFRVAFAADYTKFGSNYFAFGGRERSKCEIAAQVLF
jgi:hypothetical protein